jgi:hypothetical protein
MAYNWKKDAIKKSKNLSNAMTSVELMLTGPTPVPVDLRVALALLQKRIREARKVTRHSRANNTKAYRRRRNRLQGKMSEAKTLYDKGVAHLESLVAVAPADKLPEVEQVVLTTPQTFVPIDAPVEELPLVVAGVLDELPPTGLELPPPLPPESFVQRHPILVGVGVLAGVGAVLGGVYYFTREEEG